MSVEDSDGWLSSGIRVAALAGGVGGAKLADGLAAVLSPDQLTIIVNTGDDFTHLGLRICPDLDTVCYTLAQLSNPITGWGRVDESWQVMESLSRLGGPDWFRLGDRDLATHLERTRRLACGQALSGITREFCAAWNVRHRVLPMTDDRIETWVETHEMGWLPFQEYFVREQCAPQVKGFRFQGADRARPAPGVLEAVEEADLVVICPSNPWVSIGPILALSPLMEVLQRKRVAIVSPIVGGKAIKGPAAKMYQELGIEPSALAVARHYQAKLQKNTPNKVVSNADDWKNVVVIDTVDSDQAGAIEEIDMAVLVTDTVMKSADDRRRLADEILSVCVPLRGRTSRL
jgi:LPPG:FO 2-phospho-L-lactate transferase